MQPQVELEGPLLRGGDGTPQLLFAQAVRPADVDPAFGRDGSEGVLRLPRMLDLPHGDEVERGLEGAC